MPKSFYAARHNEMRRATRIVKNKNKKTKKTKRKKERHTHTAYIMHPGQTLNRRVATCLAFEIDVAAFANFFGGESPAEDQVGERWICIFAFSVCT